MTNAKELICELCRQFYRQGWVSGTGGGISIREGDRVYMAPSGVQKERIQPEHLFELDADANVVKAPEGHFDPDTGEAKSPLAKEMREIMARASEQGVRAHYGLSDPAEFIAEATMNPQFRALLKSTPMHDGAGAPSLWSKLVRWVRQLLGMPTSTTHLYQKSLIVPSTLGGISTTIGPSLVSIQMKL